LLFFIALGTVVMAYMATGVEMSNDHAAVVPESDPDLIYFRGFKKSYREDANGHDIGMRDSNIYRLDNFRYLDSLTKQIREMEGVTSVLSLPALRYLAIDSFTQAPYRQEILCKRLLLRKAVAVTLMETGPGIIYLYISLVLFGGKSLSGPILAVPVQWAF
jgi:hypothetical protein